ncbi:MULTISPECIES: T9SS type A sorting domain-containing protein [unclassified Polaribacter]|jgi:predicted ATPase|uniref:T9SS type A sorting domain-containing protein n=1 Tax=unclassified Polaribacter TaxID=196858 RepID=UPI001C4E92FB|nr:MULTISPECIES: T9SS type A sorting domain-containing protein [unclassified Polaribacter]QXP63889.1 T9SS type A sorting domain-containing protein [Polaribacter sp. HaHaR_3_91]QXP66389.1 T9SS type A sorting domain-containing protein [Polaribacter sp. AHE13PA]QXP71882.1 T9SS type A sorting domain-containing protein [Polaribacter sp. R2A056_3_33]
MDFSVIINDENSLSTNGELKLLNEIYTYPNPNEENINIYLNNLENVSVKLVSVNGQTIYTENNISSLIHTIKLNDISSRIYFLKVNYKGTRKQYKIIRK